MATNLTIANPTVTTANFARICNSRYRSTFFFNRKKEVEEYSKILGKDQKPLMHVFTGPPNSGKTALLKKVLKIERWEDRKSPVVALDMRGIPFSAAPSFLNAMEESLAPWYDRMIDIDATLVPAKLYKRDMTVLSKFFSFVVKNLPKFSLSTSEKFPILFIDHADKISKLTLTKEGTDALQLFLEFLIKCTKHFPVVLASSDSFYRLWLAKFIGADKFKTHVIGHLSKKEAKKYWEEHALPEYRKVRPSFKAPKFEDVFAVCGGNFMLMDRYCEDYVINNGSVLPEHFSFVQQQMNRLTSYGLLKSQTKWTGEQFFTVMNRMNENGYVVYDDLCDEMTEEVVDAMIKANLIYLRPTHELTFDLEYKGKESILTPTSPSSAAAMKLIVKNEKHLIN
uniref:ATPase domain-containing protein n=1 Tax=Amphimedon queenslandica TaxID=400682 RepID=A0A1X7VJC3_AMPQE